MPGSADGLQVDGQTAAPQVNQARAAVEDPQEVVPQEVVERAVRDHHRHTMDGLEMATVTTMEEIKQMDPPNHAYISLEPPPQG